MALREQYQTWVLAKYKAQLQNDKEIEIVRFIILVL